MNILVIGGGISNEREVSLRSAHAVFEAIRQKFDAQFYDWDGSSEWLTSHVAQFDMALPILHGSGGEDGTIQYMLEDLQIPYLGSNAAVSAQCFNKEATLQLLKQHDITIPVSMLVSHEEYLESELLSRPHVLKPFDSGSSVDTFIYPMEAASIDLGTVKDAFSRHPQMLLEEYVSGTEITVPILEGKELEIIEIIPPESGVFDYENKYNGQTKELVPPQHVSEALQLEARRLGRRIHELAGCRHLSRIDMIISNDLFYVLEINTIPGLTNQSLFPKAAAASGLAFPDLIEHCIRLVKTEAASA